MSKKQDIDEISRDDFIELMDWLRENNAQVTTLMLNSDLLSEFINRGYQVMVCTRTTDGAWVYLMARDKKNE